MTTEFTQSFSLRGSGCRYHAWAPNGGISRVSTTGIGYACDASYRGVRPVVRGVSIGPSLSSASATPSERRPPGAPPQTVPGTAVTAAEILVAPRSPPAARAAPDITGLTSSYQRRVSPTPGATCRHNAPKVFAAGRSAKLELGSPLQRDVPSDTPVSPLSLKHTSQVPTTARMSERMLRSDEDGPGSSSLASNGKVASAGSLRGQNDNGRPSNGPKALGQMPSANLKQRQVSISGVPRDTSNAVRGKESDQRQTSLSGDRGNSSNLPGTPMGEQLKLPFPPNTKMITGHVFRGRFRPTLYKSVHSEIFAKAQDGENSRKRVGHAKRGSPLSLPAAEKDSLKRKHVETEGKSKGAKRAKSSGKDTPSLQIREATTARPLDGGQDGAVVSSHAEKTSKGRDSSKLLDKNGGLPGRNGRQLRHLEECVLGMFSALCAVGKENGISAKRIIPSARGLFLTSVKAQLSSGNASEDTLADQSDLGRNAGAASSNKGKGSAAKVQSVSAPDLNWILHQFLLWNDRLSENGRSREEREKRRMEVLQQVIIASAKIERIGDAAFGANNASIKIDESVRHIQAVRSASKVIQFLLNIAVRWEGEYSSEKAVDALLALERLVNWISPFVLALKEMKDYILKKAPSSAIYKQKMLDLKEEVMTVLNEKHVQPDEEAIVNCMKNVRNAAERESQKEGFLKDEWSALAANIKPVILEFGKICREVFKFSLPSRVANSKRNELTSLTVGTSADGRKKTRGGGESRDREGTERPSGRFADKPGDRSRPKGTVPGDGRLLSAAGDRKLQTSRTARLDDAEPTKATRHGASQVSKGTTSEQRENMSSRNGLGDVEFGPPRKQKLSGVDSWDSNARLSRKVAASTVRRPQHPEGYYLKESGTRESASGKGRGAESVGGNKSASGSAIADKKGRVRATDNEADRASPRTTSNTLSFKEKRRFEAQSHLRHGDGKNAKSSGTTGTPNPPSQNASAPSSKFNLGGGREGFRNLADRAAPGGAASVGAGTKRGPDTSVSPDPLPRRTRKRVRFADSRVGTPADTVKQMMGTGSGCPQKYSLDDLSSVSWDKIHVLSNEPKTLVEAVDERAKQMTLGSVLAFYGYVRKWVHGIHTIAEHRSKMGVLPSIVPPAVICIPDATKIAQRVNHPIQPPARAARETYSHEVRPGQPLRPSWDF